MIYEQILTYFADDELILTGKKKKKITTLKNVDMVHILLGENTPSRATVQACINFNASYRLRNLKKKKKIITNTRVKFL